MIPTFYSSSLFELIYGILAIFGVGGGMLVGLYLFGLIGGLIALLLYKRKILRLPNYKISLFIGYLVFVFIFFFIPALYQVGLEWLEGAFLFYLPFLQIFVILILLTLFDKKKVFNSYYWAFITSYLLSCFILSFIPLLFGSSFPF